MLPSHRESTLAGNLPIQQPSPEPLFQTPMISDLGGGDPDVIEAVNAATGYESGPEVALKFIPAGFAKRAVWMDS